MHAFQVRAYNRFGNQPGKYYVYISPQGEEFRSKKLATKAGFIPDEAPDVDWDYNTSSWELQFWHGLALTQA